MWGSKTTLVDRVLRDCNVAITSDRVMDRNELEKERGITIMSKVTSVTHGEHRINGTYSYGRQAGGGGGWSPPTAGDTRSVRRVGVWAVLPAP